MSDDDLKGIVAQEIRNSEGYQGGELATQREKAMDYYLGAPFGNEQDGRSVVIMTVVRDVIESAMPSLMEMMAGGDDVVEFEPFGPEDEDAAKQATDYCNHVLMKDNPGFLIIHDMLKDGAISKMGAAKVWTEDFPTTTVKTLSGLGDDELAALLEEDGIEPTAHSEYPDPSAMQQMQMAMDQAQMAGQPAPMMPPTPPMLHDVTIRRTTKEKRVKVENIPPEELLVSRWEKNNRNPKFIGHKTRKTRSELIEMGYDRETIESLPADDASRLYGEELARAQKSEQWPGTNSSVDEANKEISVVECYIRVDYDGDGVAELRRMIVAGGGGTDSHYEILENDEVDKHKIAVWSPIRIPHVFHGLSLADLTMDIQLIESTIVRQTLDNLYNTNNARMEVAESHAGDNTLDDLMVNRPGGLVRTRQPGGLVPIVTAPIMDKTLPMMEFLEGVKENRVGVTRYNQGADADSLNKTAKGIGMIMTASQKRLVMVARMFAETGFKDMFRMILHEVITNQDKARTIRLRNEWVPMDPRYWNAEMDLTINVGLGYGTKEAQSQALGNILGIQQKMIEMQGGYGGLVTEEKVYNTLEKLITTSAGFRTAEPFFAKPGEVPPPPPKPDPEMMKVKAQVEGQKQITAAKIQGDQMKAASDIQINREKAQADIQAKQEGQLIDASLAKREQDLKFQSGGYAAAQPQGKDQR